MVKSLSKIASMRRKLRRFSMLIAVFTALTVPVGYLVASLVHANAMMSEFSQYYAERLAQYAYTSGPAWEYSGEHIVTLIQPRQRLKPLLQQTVRNADGVVIATRGHVAGPHWRTAAPIVVAGEQLGEIETTITLTPTLWQSLAAAVLGALLGGGAYLAMHLLPMRSLTNALSELQSAMLAKQQMASETAGAFRELEGSYRALEETKHDLEAARNRAKAADRSKSAFLASMSHELRTPLNAIIGFSEMISSEVFGPIGHPKYCEYATDIRDSGQHLVNLVGDVLDLSKIEVGKLTLNPQPVDLPHVLNDCLRVMRGRAEESSITLRIEAAPASLPVIVADELRIKQILLNLLSNSWKFTPEGGTITISADSEIEGFVRIKVTDTGIGMDAKDLHRVMSPFEQAKTHNYAKMEGSGLGLPLARALARQHGGDLVLESAVGTGTMAVVTLPVSALPPRSPLEVRSILEDQDRNEKNRTAPTTGDDLRREPTRPPSGHVGEPAVAE